MQWFRAVTLYVSVILYSETKVNLFAEEETHASPEYPKEESENAELDDAPHRGMKSSSDETESSYDSGSVTTDDESSFSSDNESSESRSLSASSKETSDEERRNRVWRECISCPTDMLKSYRNVGIKWICGGYQRARRSFKSECMMRYRNCEDGTMFVKIYENRCRNDSYHGRHFFYMYQT